jgi:hypothetical protein
MLAWRLSPALLPSPCRPRSARPLILSQANHRAKHSRSSRRQDVQCSRFRLLLLYRQGRAALARAFPHPHLPFHTRSHPLRKAIVSECVLLTVSESPRPPVSSSNPTVDTDNSGVSLGLNHGSCIMRKSLSFCGLQYFCFCGVRQL